MAPALLTNLFTTPLDVIDLLSSEAVDMRLDDHNQATGQTISVTANQVAGATTLNVKPLTSALLNGTNLTFDGGGMAAPLIVVLSAVGRIGDTVLTVQALGAAVNSFAAASDSGVNTALAARLVKGCNYATSQVTDYCGSRYDVSDMVNSWTVNRWATPLAARWVCKRVLRSCPEGLQKECEDAIEEMKLVQRGMMQIGDIATRTPAWPWISNLTVDLSYNYAKLRVERPLSELSQVYYNQQIDWQSSLSLEW